MFRERMLRMAFGDHGEGFELAMDAMGLEQGSGFQLDVGPCGLRVRADV